MNSSIIYKGMSKVYDLLDIIYFKNNNRNPRNTLLDFINKQDTKILDICTGTAANAIAIAKRRKDAKIVGIDISQEMLQIAKKKVNERNLNNIELLNMDASDTTFADNTFDVVIISLVLHEIPQDLSRRILLETKRILKPEGKLLVMEWEEPQSLLKKLLFFPIRKLEPKGFDRFLQCDLKSYFEKFDFEISKIKHCDFTKVLYIKNAAMNK